MGGDSKKINSHDKGARGERELVSILNKRFPEKKFFRTVRSGAFTGGTNRINTTTLSESQKSALTSDIFCDDDKFRFSIESKFYEEASFWDLFNESSDLHRFMKQCESDAEFIHKSPMLVVKYNRHPQIVFIKEEIKEEPIFSHRGWFCYLFEEFLKHNDEYFFEEK